MDFYKKITKFKRKKIKKELKYSFRIFALFIAVVMIWRSLWNFLEVYILPWDFLLSNLITLLVWLIIVYFSEYTLEDMLG